MTTKQGAWKFVAAFLVVVVVLYAIVFFIPPFDHWFGPHKGAGGNFNATNQSGSVASPLQTEKTVAVSPSRSFSTIEFSIKAYTYLF